MRAIGDWSWPENPAEMANGQNSRKRLTEERLVDGYVSSLGMTSAVAFMEDETSSIKRRNEEVFHEIPPVMENLHSRRAMGSVSTGIGECRPTRIGSKNPEGVDCAMRHSGDNKPKIGRASKCKFGRLLTK
ncbi:hypothetical protein Ancab_001213 [Ancistrocladus abbreviatus]